MPGELTACRWRRAAIVPALALAFLTVSPGLPDALADAAAGSAAFEKGDYVRAMAEWASAAERGDPDAEFGLGMLYERGDGAVRQSYKEADRWYQKAAEHDHVGAQYRLALIWSAGSDGFSSRPRRSLQMDPVGLRTRAGDRGQGAARSHHGPRATGRGEKAGGKVEGGTRGEEETGARRPAVDGCFQRGTSPSIPSRAFLSVRRQLPGNPAGALAGRSRLCRAPNNFRRCPGRPRRARRGTAPRARRPK